MARPSKQSLLGAALILLAGGACAAPSMRELMRIAFPGWSPDRAQIVALVAANPVWDQNPQPKVLAEPKLLLRTGPHSLTLIAGLVPAYADGASVAAHPTPMGLGAYHFRRVGSAWALDQRQDGFGYQGYFGAATLREAPLSDTRQGIAVESRSCWQGYCGTWVALYELDGGQFKTAPAAEAMIGAINVFGTDDCAKRLRPLQVFKIAPSRTDDADRPHDCYAIKSTWSFAPAAAEPGDLIIHFKGVFSKGSEQGPAAKPVRIDQRQVLRYRDGKYEPLSGSNPVPNI